MSGCSRKIFALVCAVCSAGCLDVPEPEIITGPTVETSPPDVISSLRLSPDTLSLEEGAEFQLGIEIRNQKGQRIFPVSSVSYSTTDASVAVVGQAGFVVTLHPGKTVIRASITAGQSVLVDSTIVSVSQAEVHARLDLIADTFGWKPALAHVVSGGDVTWEGGYIATAGVPVHTVYLWRSDVSRPTVEAMDLTKGPATRTLIERGSYYYCSNDCWDHEEWGIVVVH